MIIIAKLFLEKVQSPVKRRGDNIRISDCQKWQINTYEKSTKVVPTVEAHNF